MGSYASQTHKPIPLSSQTADNNKNKPSNTGRRNGIIGDLIHLPVLLTLDEV